MIKTKKRYDCALGCPVEVTLDLVGGKWKGVIVYHSWTQRFGSTN